MHICYLQIILRLSSVRSRVVSTQASDRITVDVDPLLLGWAIELSEALASKQPIKCRSINNTIMVILVLHMNQHFYPSDDS